MGITSRVWAYALFVTLLMNSAFAAKVAKIRLEDIENDNNKKTQEATQSAQAAAKQQPQLAQQAPPGAFLPQQYFQFAQQGLPDYSAALQGGSHPQLYLGQRDQLALLEALGHQQPAFTSSPFHGLYGQADGQGVAQPSSFNFGHLPVGGIHAGLSASGAYGLPSPSLFAQGDKLQVDAKFQQQQNFQPQLQFQQIPQKQQIPQQLQQKVQPQLQQQFQQVAARPQYVPQQGHQVADQQQQIAALQQQFAPQQQFFQLSQYLQQLTQQPQYQQQFQAAPQQQQLHGLPQQIQAVQQQPQLQQQHLQLQQQQPQLQQQHLQLQQQQPQLQAAVQAGNAKFQPSQEVRQGPIAISQQYFQPTQGQQQYLQPGQHQFLQAAQQDLLSARPVFQQPFVYQGGASVIAQPQKTGLQNFSGGNQILVGYGGNQVSDKSPALAVKREGQRRGVRPGEAALAGAVAYARGGYTS